MKPRLGRPSPRFFVSVGLSALLATILLLAVFLDVVPDRIAAVRNARAHLAESVAANTAMLATAQDVARVQAMLDFIVSRNADLQSAAVRASDGTLVAQTAGHLEHWQPMKTRLSSDTQVQVPIHAGQAQWGAVELRFLPLVPDGFAGLFAEPRLRMVGFVVLAAFVAFYLYLGRVLRQLDPSQAIPARVRTAFDTMAEGLVVLDTDGFVVLANEAFCKVIGASAAELIGKSVTAFPWADDAGRPVPAEACPWTSTLESGESARGALVRLANAGGARRTFIVNASPILADGSRHRGVLVSFDDVTELQEKEIALRIARDQAEAASRAKSEFLANMSHEIRTPMNAILGFADILRRGYHKDDAEMRRHLDTIHGSGSHLLALINDALDLAKVESGQLQVERLACAPWAVVREVVDTLSIPARQCALDLRLEVRDRIPRSVVTDPLRLRQIVMNLVSNAIKFTERGEVRVVLSMESGNGQLLSVAVSDTGIGIPADRLEAIFEPFVQAEGSTTRRFGGTGLGLTISRRLARALGGDLTVTSSPGEGSTFRVTIDPGPLQGVELLAADALAADGDRRSEEQDMDWAFDGGQVLVVDDAAENREFLRVILEQAGLRVREAIHGAAALEAVAADAPDLVLMDVHMPVMDGITAVGRLRTEGFARPVIALTADAIEGFDTRLAAVGFDEWLTKPVDVDTLLGRLADRLGARRVRRERVEKPPELPRLSLETTAELPPVVSRFASHPRLRSAVNSFIRQLPIRLDSMEHALSDGDLPAVAELAHWLKGSAGTVGLDAFTPLARELETFAKQGDRARAADALTAVRALARRVQPCENAAEAAAAPAA